jgi:hypothetical protein
MPFGSIISGALGFLAAGEQADATREAANISAAAQREAARQAAEAAKFRPVGITSRYGTSNFQMSPEGYLTGAGYNLSPDLKAYQDRLMGLTGGALTQAEQAQQQYAPLQTAAGGLFGLGQQYLAQSPEQVAAKYIQQQQDLLAPSRERQMAQLQNQLFQQGRGGLSVGATGTRPSGAAGLGATTPEMEAYYNAIAQQDAQLAAQAQQAGQQNVAFGAGLFGTGANMLGQYQAGQVSALNPFTTYLGAGQTIEELGQAPLKLGAALGGQAAAYGANVGQSLLTGGISAARAQQAGAGGSPLGGLLQGAAGNQQLQTGFEKFFGGYSQPVQTGYTGSPTMQPYENEQLANSFQYGDSSGYYQPKRSF